MTVSTVRALCAAVVLALAALAPSGASAAPAPSAHPPLEAGSLLVEVMNCREVRAFCRGRWRGGPNYRQCVRARGCRVEARPAVSYCREQNRICRARWGGDPRYFRCMARRGC